MKCRAHSRSFFDCSELTTGQMTAQTLTLTAPMLWPSSLACVDGKALFILTHIMHFDHILFSSLPSHGTLFSSQNPPPSPCVCTFPFVYAATTFNQGCLHEHGGRLYSFEQGHLTSHYTIRITIPAPHSPSPQASITFPYLLREEWSLLGKAPKYP